MTETSSETAALTLLIKQPPVSRHTRIARRDDFVSRPLDFEDYRRVFKFWIPWARFRDRRFWWDPSATDAGRRYRIATPVP